MGTPAADNRRLAPPPPITGAGGGVSPRAPSSTGDSRGGVHSPGAGASGAKTSFRVGEFDVPGLVVVGAPPSPPPPITGTPAVAENLGRVGSSGKNKGGGGSGGGGGGSGGGGSASQEGFVREGSGGGNGNGGKKPAWNKPSNGSVETGVVVMGAEAWPPLSESTKVPMKSSSSDSFKNLSDSSASLAMVTGSAPSLVLPVSPSQKHGSGGANPSTPHNHHGRPARQKSMKRDGGSSSGSANGGFSHPPPSHGSVGEGSHNNSSVKGGSGGGSDGSGRDRDHGHNNSNRDSGQRNSGDHPQQRYSHRRGNGGQHSRGDSSHQNYGGRRDHDRGNPDWNHQRSFGGRDPYASAPSPYARGPIRPPPPVTAPVFPAGPFHQPFVGPVIAPEYPHFMYLTSPMAPIVAPMPPMYMAPQEPPPLQDSSLPGRIVQQIEYYFSNENLVKDTYLRKQMDNQGWVPISLISGFKKMTELTNNTQLILEAVKVSSVVEVQGDRIRRRDDWDKWIMPPSVQSPMTSGANSPRIAGTDMLVAHVQSLGLDDKTGGFSSMRGPAQASEASTLSSGM